MTAYIYNIYNLEEVNIMLDCDFGS